MTTNASASNIQNSGQVASAATAKKTGKHSAATALSELFSNSPQQVKSVTKSNTVSFKKILEPAKAASVVSVAKAVRPQEEKAETAALVPCVPVCPVGKQAQQTPEAKTSPSVNQILTKDLPQKKVEQQNSNIKPTIDPRSPMHGEVLGNNDSGRTLVTDGPKTKENGAAQKHTKDGMPTIEPNTVSDNALGKNTVSKLQTASVQTILPPEVTTIPVSENKAKTPASKSTATGTEKTHGHYKTSDTEGNAHNITDKQVKAVQSRAEIVYHKQNQESAAAPAKIDTKVAAVSEQFSPPTVSATGTANVNASATATNAAANAGANVHEQIASAAVTASHKVGQRIAVNLNPPELGRISIKFEKNGDEVIGRVEVEKSQTKNQIDLNLSQIVQNLQDSGVQLKRLEVVLQDQSLGNQQEFTGQTQRDWNGNHHFESEKNYADIHSVLSAGDQFSYSAQSGAHFSDKSVNILV
jgi:flagellar hook-length control protein FliK